MGQTCSKKPKVPVRIVPSPILKPTPTVAAPVVPTMIDPFPLTVLTLNVLPWEGEVPTATDKEVTIAPLCFVPPTYAISYDVLEDLRAYLGSRWRFRRVRGRGASREQHHGYEMSATSYPPDKNGICFGMSEEWVGDPSKSLLDVDHSIPWSHALVLIRFDGLSGRYEHVVRVAVGPRSETLRQLCVVRDKQVLVAFCAVHRRVSAYTVNSGTLTRVAYLCIARGPYRIAVALDSRDTTARATFEPMNPTFPWPVHDEKECYRV